MANYCGAHFPFLSKPALGNSVQFIRRAALSLSHVRVALPSPCLLGRASMVLHRLLAFFCDASGHRDSWAESLLSFPPQIRENQGMTLEPSQSIQWKCFGLWILTSGGIVDGLEINLMVKLNQYRDSLME
jgi:hypothetical protein